MSDIFDFQEARQKRDVAQDQHIGGQFKRARLSFGMTQLDMAPYLGCDNQELLSQIERGLIEPSASMYRLLQAYIDGYRPTDWPEDNPY